jgi:hypothetical protein
MVVGGQERLGLAAGVGDHAIVEPREHHGLAIGLKPRMSAWPGQLGAQASLGLFRGAGVGRGG